MGGQQRYGKGGWYNESYRHKLAANGIQTAKYMKRKRPLDPSIAEGFFAHKGFMKEDLPETAKMYVDTDGTIVAYDDPVSGDAEAVDEDYLQAANKRGIRMIEPGEDIEKLGEVPHGEMPLSPMEMEMDRQSPFLDIPMEVRNDLDFETGFRLSDTFNLPGSLAKDAGSVFGDMVNFARAATPRKPYMAKKTKET